MTQVSFTLFPSVSCNTQDFVQCSFDAFVRGVGKAESRAAKEALPMIAMSRFGRDTSKNGSLKHADNLLGITGVMGDHDTGAMSPEEARVRLESAGVLGVVVTTSSHTCERPRWHAFCPTSVEHPPGAQHALLARLNGVLGGVLSTESGTPAQGFYIGGVVGKHPIESFVSKGEFIDILDELDDTAIPVKKTSGPNGTPGLSWTDESWEPNTRTEDQELIRQVVSGESIHEPMVALAARYAGRGMSQKAILGTIEGLIKAAPAEEDRKQARLADLPRAVDSAMEKFGKPQAVALASIKPIAKGKTEQQPLIYPKPLQGAFADAVAWGIERQYRLQPDLAMIGILVGFAGACGNRYRFSDGTRLNLYATGIAESGAGKESPLNSARDLVAASVTSVVAGKPKSGAGLEDLIMDFPQTVLAVDEIGHLLAVTEGSRGDANAIDLASVMLQLFSRGASRFDGRILAGKEPRSVLNPTLSILGFATPRSFNTAITIGSVENGLVGRMLFVVGDNNPKAVEPSGPIALPEPLERLVAQIGGASGASCLIELDDPSYAVELRQKMEPVGGDDVYRAIKRRSFEKAKRIAGICAAIDNPGNPWVQRKHWDFAEALVNASDKAILRIISDDLHPNKAMENKAAVLKVIRDVVAGKYKEGNLSEARIVEKKLAPRSLCVRRTKLSARDFNDAVALLEDGGEIEVLKIDTPTGKGRTVPVDAYREI